MVDPEIGEEVPHKQIGPPPLAADRVQDAANDSQAYITQYNQLGILCLIQRAAGVEMVDTTEDAILLALAATLALTLMLVVASDIGDEICRPAAQLLIEDMGQSGDGGVLSQLVELVSKIADAASVFLPCLGDENHVSLHVAGGFVVFAMRDLPRKVWYHQQ